MKQPDKQKVIEKIALDHLFIETLETQHRDRLDFHDVSVWAVIARCVTGAWPRTPANCW